MYFPVEKQIHPQTGVTVRGWAPRFDIGETEAPSTGFVEVNLSYVDTPRMVLAGVARMGAIFNKDTLTRAKLRHDCGVFALACATGETFDNTPFWGKGDLEVRTKTVELCPPDTWDVPTHTPGDVIFTFDEKFVNGMVAPKGPHFAVLATDPNDGEVPLWCSKNSASGAASLMTLPDTLSLYPAQTITIARGLHAFSPAAR